MKTTIDQKAADEQAVMDSFLHGTPIPPEVKDRLRERGRKVREDMLRRFGVQEIAVDLIRESRE